MGYGGYALTAPPYGLVDAMQRFRANESALRQQAAEEAAVQAVPQDLSSLAATSPEVRTAVPVQPAIPPTVTESPIGAPVVDEEGIERGAPSTMTATPGSPEKPAVTVEGHTLSSLVKKMGPETVARLMSTKQGRQALQDKGVLTDEEMSKRTRVAQARNEFKDLMEKGRDAMLTGDASGSLMFQARAWERVADGSDDPNKAAWAHQLSNNLQKQALEARDNIKANDDFRVFGTAWAAYQKLPNHENLDKLLGAASGMESKEGRGLRDRLYQNMTQDALKGLNNPRLAELYDEVSTKLSESSKAGTKMTLGQAFNKVLQEKPELVGPLIQSYLSGKTGILPDEVTQALFGEMNFKREEFKVAQMLTERVDGLRLDDPNPEKSKQAAQAFARHLKDLFQATRRGTPIDDVMERFNRTQVRQTMESDLREADRLQGDLMKDTYYKIYGNNLEKAPPAIRSALQEKLDQISALRDRAESARRWLNVKNPGVQGPMAPGAGPAKQLQRLTQPELLGRMKDWRTKNPSGTQQQFIEEMRRQGIDASGVK